LKIDKIDNTADNDKPVSGLMLAALNLKLNKADTLLLSNRINTKLAKTDTAGLSNRINSKLAKTDTAGLSNRINTKAPINNPTFTGIVNGISASMVGLGNVNNTTDLLKPVSIATETALNLKLNKADTVTLSNRINSKLAKSDTVGLSNRINTKLAKTDTAGLSNRINTKLAKADTAGLSNRINTKSPINNPTFTGIVNGITKNMVGLGNVDNTTDAAKPVSTATQTALNLKLNNTDTAGLRNSINTKLAKADTLGLSNRINSKLSKTDTAGLSNRINTKLAKADTLGLSNRINSKLAKTDTAGISNRINTKLAKTDTAGLSNRINSKLAIADTLALSNRINSKLAKADTTSLSVRINQKLNISDTTSLRNGINARATIASPTFTGTPLAPTATAGTSSNQIATTAFVQDAFTNFSTSNGSSSSTLSGAIWTSSTTGTLNGVGFTMTQLRDANPSNWDMSTSDFSAAPLSATQNSGTISHGDDWVVTFASPVSDLKLYCKYWRTASYVFSQPLTLLSSGNGLTSPNSTTVSVGANAWGNGIIQFAGPITTLSVNSSASLIYDASGQILTFGVGSVGPTSGSGEIIRSTSPTFTGTVTGITKAMVGLGDADNTSDLSKPISNATQAALNDKLNSTDTAGLRNGINARATIVSPTFTGIPTLPSGTIGVTQTAGDSTTALATTAFVTAANASNAQNFVDVTTAQTIVGAKTFSSDISVNGLTIGSNGNSSMMGRPYSSTIVGYQATVGTGFSAAGESSVFGYKASATGPQSIAIGSEATANQTQGISIGYHSSIGTGYGFAIGSYSQSNGMYSVALGPFSQTSGNYSVALGYQANATAENSIAIGKDASVTTANTIQLGNTDVTNVKTSGTLTAGAITIPNTDGTNGQVLATNGSGSLAWTTPVTLADFIALKNKIDSLTNSVVNLNSQISQLRNSGSWTPIVDSGTISIVNANYFVSNNIVYVSGNFTDANFDSQGYVDINIPVSANFANNTDVVGTVLGIMAFGESVSGYVEAIPNSSKVRLTARGAHYMSFGTKGSFVFSYKLPGATSSSFYTPVVSSGTGVFSSTNYIVKDNIVTVNGNFKNANLDDYGAYIDINLPISTNFVDSTNASGIISGTAYGFESLSGYIYALVGTNTVRLRASGAHGMGFNTNGSFVFSYKINPANNTSSYNPTVLSGIGNFSNANYFTIGNVVYVSGNFTNANFDGMSLYVDNSIPGNNFFNNAADVIGSVSGITMGQSVSGYVEAIPNSSTVRLKAAGAHNMAFGTNGSFIFSFINQ